MTSVQATVALEGSFVGRSDQGIGGGGLLDDNCEVEGTKCGSGVGTRQRVEYLPVGTHDILVSRLMKPVFTSRLFVSSI